MFSSDNKGIYGNGLDSECRRRELGSRPGRVRMAVKEVERRVKFWTMGIVRRNAKTRSGRGQDVDRRERLW